MLNGHSPFEAEDHLATYQKILDGTVNYPQAMNPDATDLISKLLQKDISRRYGNLREGAKDIKDHAFFKGAQFPWDNPFGERGSIRPDAFNQAKCAARSPASIPAAAGSRGLGQGLRRRRSDCTRAPTRSL